MLIGGCGNLTLSASCDAVSSAQLSDILLQEDQTLSFDDEDSFESSSAPPAGSGDQSMEVPLTHDKEWTGTNHDIHAIPADKSTQSFSDIIGQPDMELEPGLSSLGNGELKQQSDAIGIDAVSHSHHLPPAESQENSISPFPFAFRLIKALVSVSQFLII